MFPRRYPAGESYLDVIQRLEPVIIEMERERECVCVVGHQVRWVWETWLNFGEVWYLVTSRASLTNAIQRLEPVVIKMEREREGVCVVSTSWDQRRGSGEGGIWRAPAQVGAPGVEGGHLEPCSPVCKAVRGEIKNVAGWQRAPACLCHRGNTCMHRQTQ